MVDGLWGEKQVGMNKWLLGSGRGVYQSDDGWQWTRLAAYDYRMMSLVADEDGIVGACGSGLWHIVPDNPIWVQLHDETLTEVMDVARLPDGFVAASAYGVATGQYDDAGVMRWQWHSDDLPVNARFTHAVVVDSPTRWVIGTEAGVLVSEDAGVTWARTSLTGVCVMKIKHLDDCWWACAQDGVWMSDDGMLWQRAGKGLDGCAVFDVDACGDDLVLGTENGVWRGEGHGAWEKVGLHGQVHGIGVHKTQADLWLAGCVPGGVWVTDSAGVSWSYLPDLPDSVETVLAPVA